MVVSENTKEIRLKLSDLLPISGESDLISDYTNVNSLDNFLFDDDGIYKYDCVIYSGIEETAIISHAIDKFTSGRDNQSIIFRFNSISQFYYIFSKSSFILSVSTK